MYRVEGVSMPGFAVGLLIGGFLAIVAELSYGISIGVGLATWILVDAKMIHGIYQEKKKREAFIKAQEGADKKANGAYPPG